MSVGLVEAQVIFRPYTCIQLLVGFDFLHFTDVLLLFHSWLLISVKMGSYKLLDCLMKCVTVYKARTFYIDIFY